MGDLYAYPPRDRGLVDEQFFEGEKEITEEDLTGELAVVGADADLDEIRSTLDDIVDGRVEYENLHEIDADVAPVVHESLDLNRKQAAQPGIWHWMAIVFHPEFVRFRWPYDDSDRTYDSMREKFLGAGTDIYSNAFGRLWWMAELSYAEEADDPYEITRKALETQYLANRLFDPAFARYRPAVVAFADVLADEPTKIVRHANRRFNQALSTIQAESRDADQLRSIVKDVVEGVEEDYEL